MFKTVPAQTRTGPLTVIQVARFSCQAISHYNLLFHRFSALGLESKSVSRYLSCSTFQFLLDLAKHAMSRAVRVAMRPCRPELSRKGWRCRQVSLNLTPLHAAKQG